MNDESPELNFQQFVQARQEFRSQAPTQARVSENDEGKSVLYSAGPDHLFAVFENSQQDGWFYLFDAKQRTVVKGVPIYESSTVAVQVEEDVVDIGWAVDDSACGLALWGQFRAFIGVQSDLQIRKPVLSVDEDGIPSTKWPAGFEHYLEPKAH